MKHWHLISYDIRDDKRRRVVSRVLEGYGSRIQFSVFRCFLDDISLEKLHWELNQTISAEDHLLIIPLCSRCAGQVPDHSTGDQTVWTQPVEKFRML